jgi:uncharacterized protein (DUF58 family)
MIKLAITAMLLLLVAMLLNLNLLVYAVYSIAGVLLVCRWVTARWSQDITATRRKIPQQVEVGDDVSVAVDVAHVGTLPISWILIDDMLEKRALLAKVPAIKVKGDSITVQQMAPGAVVKLRYEIKFKRRGYYQIGPVVIETGDLLGLNRRFKVLTEPVYVTVLPQVAVVGRYDIASRRPIGEVVMTHRLFEDPTRIAGVRKYQNGDALSRVHWRATARTGTLQCKVFEPSTLAGATIAVDFHVDAFDPKHEPVRSELAIKCAASIADTLQRMGQQVGLVSNATDAADRIRLHGWRSDQRTRAAAKQSAQMADESDRLNPVIVPTRKSPEQMAHILQALARMEISKGLALPDLLFETQAQIPRDATVIVIVSRIKLENAVALGGLVRQGYSVEVIVNCFSDEEFLQMSGPLINQGLVCRHLKDDSSIATICEKRAAV